MSGKSKVVELSRAVDQKQELIRSIGDIDEFDIMSNRVLVATYIEPEKTVGGIILPQSRTNESKFQGKIGLVMKKGPLAFKDDEATRFYGQDIKIHSWVFYRPSDGWHFLFKGVDCRMIEDVHIMGVIPHPDYIW